MSLLIIIILSIIVFLILLLPVRKKTINFDEKAYAIKVYKEELSILEHRKNTYRIDKKTYENLKIELERKSVLSFLSIDKKFFSYKESIIYIPICLIFIAIAGAFYTVHSGNNKSLEFLRFKDANRLKIEEGISNKFVFKEFSKDEKELRYYCFSLQQLVLAKHTKNSEALANLAFCQMNMGTLILTQDTIRLGLQVDKNHPELNYLFAQTNLMRFRKLDKASKNALKITLKKDPKHIEALWLLGNYSGNYVAAEFFLKNLNKPLEFSKFKVENKLKIEDGILNRFAFKEFLTDKKHLKYYCFSLQQLVLEKYTKDAEAWSSLAFCQMKMETLEALDLAQDSVKLGLQVNKNHPELNFLFAQTNLMRFRKLDKASINALKITLKENPDHMAALWLLGNYSYTSGNYEAAKFFLGKLKKLSANNEIINNLLLKIEKEINTATKNNKKIKK